MTTWLITGCSAGLGRALAEEVLREGDQAVVTARDTATVADLADAYPSQALTVALDVTRPDQIVAAVRAGEERFGGIDVLVNNAGYGYRSAVEEGEDEDVRQLFEVHVHGPVNLIKAVLPGMRSRRSGCILTISSIAASVKPAGSGYYAAVKCAIEGISGSLRKELAPLGINVTSVEPGGFRTEFAGRSLTGTSTVIDDYADTVGPRRVEVDTAHGTQPGDPAKGARLLRELALSDHAPGLALMGSDALTVVRSALQTSLAEIDQWAQASAGTDRDDVAATRTGQA